jgi:hypothetical protein
MKSQDMQQKLYSQGMFIFDTDFTSLDFKKQALKEIQEFRKWKTK